MSFEHEDHAEPEGLLSLWQTSSRVDRSGTIGGAERSTQDFQEAQRGEREGKRAGKREGERQRASARSIERDRHFDDILLDVPEEVAVDGPRRISEEVLDQAQVRRGRLREPLPELLCDNLLLFVKVPAWWERGRVSAKAMRARA